MVPVLSMGDSISAEVAEVSFVAALLGNASHEVAALDFLIEDPAFRAFPVRQVVH